MPEMTDAEWKKLQDERNAAYKIADEKYTELFKKYDIRWTHKPDKPYHFGLGGCGIGWLRLIDDLFQKMIDRGWDRQLSQLKEKLGGLRVYIGAANKNVFDIIRDAESESYHICERCGAPGALRGGGWLNTLCDEHSEGRPPAKFEVPKPFVMFTPTKPGEEKPTSVDMITGEKK